MPSNDYHQALCGTLSGAPSPFNQNVLTSQTADLNGVQASVSTCYTPYYSYWPYYDSSRVAALEAKVELLEKMLAAVLAGRPAPKPSRRRK